jgi:hypothetical protein
VKEDERNPMRMVDHNVVQSKSKCSLFRGPASLELYGLLTYRQDTSTCCREMSFSSHIMDIGHQGSYCEKKHSYFDIFLTHLWYNHHDSILYGAAKQLLDNCVAIKYHSILLVFIDEPHGHSVHYPFNDNSSDTDANSDFDYFNAEQPPVSTRMYGNSQWNSSLAGMTIRNWYFDIFDNEIHLWSPFPCEKKHWFVSRCYKYNLSIAAIMKDFGYPMMATVTNFASSHPWFKSLNQMSFTICIDLWKSDTVCYNDLTNPNIIS